MSAITISAPACANAYAIALPSPMAPPVTIATLPFTKLINNVCHFYHPFNLIVY